MNKEMGPGLRGSLTVVRGSRPQVAEILKITLIFRKQMIPFWDGEKKEKTHVAFLGITDRTYYSQSHCEKAC